MELVVNGTAKQILGRNSGRKYLLFLNQHTDSIRVSFGNIPASQGILIQALGGSWELDAPLFLSLPYDSFLFQNINAVATSGSGTLTVIEA